MTNNNNICTDTNIMTDDSTSIMTDNSETLPRSVGKSKQDKDPNALKIASFRTKEGVWAEFSRKAESDGLTATDVLKAAMEQYLNGEYNPRVSTGISTVVKHTDNILTHHDILEIVNTAINTSIMTGSIRDEVNTAVSTLSIPTEDRVNELVSTAISTAVNTKIINNSIMTAISTLSLQTSDNVSMFVSTALVPITEEVEALKKLDAID